MAQESVLRIVIDSRNAERNARAVASELENLTQNGDQAETQMTAMSASIKSLVGYMGGILTINKAIAMADGYTQMAARIRNATASAEEYALVQDRVLATANTTYRQLGEAQEVYLSMAGGMKLLGYQTTQTLDLVDSLSFSFTHNATRTDQAQSAMDSLSKSMAKGKIDADAWISIVTGADNVIADMAKTTGKSEAEIRKLGAEGKASLSDLIKTLIATRDENEKLANNMENSLADGFTKLSNEVTVYLGKANEATSATGMLAGGLSSLADNLEAVANTGAVLGIGYVTSALLTKGAAVKAGLALSAQRKIADQAELVSQTQLTAAEVRRTGSIAQYTQMQLADARATAARMTGMQRLAYVQSTVIPLEVKATQATAAHTAATNADTLAQEINNKARSRGAMLLGILGGPIGAITTGVMALAAGYAYMSYRTSEANAKLVEQGKVAEKTSAELQKLTGNDKKNAVSDLTAAFSAQNETLAKSKEAVDAVLFSIRASAVENEKARKVAEDARNGLISYNDAIRMLNEMDIRPDLYEMLKKQAKEYDVNSIKAGNSQKALKALDVEVKLSGNSFQDAVNQIDKHSEALDKNKTAAQKAAEGLEAVKKSLFDREYEAYLTKALLAKGYSEDQVRVMIDTANFARKEGIQLTNEMYQAALKVAGIEEQNKKVIDSRNAAERERTKELEKQQKVLTASSKVQANAAKYNFSSLESKYGLPSGTLSAIHAIETGNTGKTNQVNKQTGATGGFQFLAGTAKQYGVKDRTDLAQSAEGAAKYMSYLLKLFKGDLEKAVRAYHAGEGNVQKGKNIGKYNNDYWQKFKGYTAGVNGFTAGDVGSKEWEKLLEEAAKMAEHQAELRKNLELNVANEVTRIRSKLSDDLQEIDKAGYSPERAKELKAEYQARADNDIAIAQQALKTKLDDYGAFKKTESQLLEDSFNERKFYAARDLELTKDQRDKAVALLDEQLKQEQALLMLAQETRLFQLREALMSETAAMQERYRLEREQILLNSKLSQEQKLREIALSKALQEEENRRRLNNAVQAWGSIQAEMNGTGDQYRLEQERFSRYDASQDVFDAQMSQVDQAAQDPNANMQEIAAQREAIWQAHHDRMTAIESDYYSNSQALQLAGMGQIASGLASIVGDMAGEQSSAYKAMFAIEKGFAIAQSALAIQTGVSKAIALGFPQNIPVIAQTVMEGAKITSAIKSITDTGFSSGGYTGPGGKYDIAGTVHKGEVVFSQEDVARWGGPSNVESLRKSSQREFKQTELVQGAKNTASSPNIIINLPEGTEVNTSKAADGTITIDVVRKEAAAAARQSWVNLNNSNSFESKQIQRNTTAEVKR
ncbi:tape measure protein [Acinetobacter radioresistens]|uniref:tape measure protein n=1 Tax=Acinetobacter radioresistens TaxID=40216 RepID=UPI00157A4B62|nr:tape measure protein [Acinetobacter radioresistens]NTY98499.1 tape measure protein [Acinetobacter radioresistens]